MRYLFNPLDVVHDVQADYRSFVLSSFPFSNKQAKDQFLEFIDQHELLWTGPYLSLARQYEQGDTTAASFCKGIGISPHLAEILPIERFFIHQEEGIRRILNGQNTIVSTGTGSGKTEVFLVPILDYCLKASAPGIKAILIYPMNALVNDQAERLRRLLFALNHRTGKSVTFGIYTGQTPHRDEREVKEKIPLQQCPIPKRLRERYKCDQLCKDDTRFEQKDETRFEPVLHDGKWVLACKTNPQVVVDYQVLTREEFSERQPDILITNYVQLEFLLLRKHDAHLFSKGQVHFLVFDELHWYSGATGCEVALLARRLVERLRYEGGMVPVCIGTSATISTKEPRAAKQEVAEFASKFFGQPFDPESVVLGKVKEVSFDETQPFLPKPLDDTTIFEDIRSLDHDSLTDAEFDDLCRQVAPDTVLAAARADTTDRQLIVGRILTQNALYQAIVRTLEQPKTKAELAEEIFNSNEGRCPDIREIYVAACDDASQAQQKLEEDIWAYLNLAGLAADPAASNEEFVPLTRPQVHMFYKAAGEDFQRGEVYACLWCGTMYPGSRERCTCGGLVEEVEVCRYCGEIYWRARFEHNVCDHSKEVKRTIGRSAIDAARRVPQGGVLLKQTVTRPLNTRKARRARKCRECGALNPANAAVCAFDGSRELLPVYVYAKVNPCPFCGNRYAPQLDTTTPLYQSPNIASRRVFSSLYNQLPEGLRKMLIFSDSRQGASFTAGTIQSEHLARAIRQLVCYLVRQQSEPLSYEELEECILKELASWEEDGKLDEWQTNLYREMILEEVGSLTHGQWSGEKVGLVEIGYQDLTTVDEELEATGQQFTSQGQLFASLSPGEKWRRFLVMVLHMMRWDRAIAGMEAFRGGRVYDKPTGYVFDPQYTRTRSGSYDIKNPLSSNRTKLYRYAKKVFPSADPERVLLKAFKMLRERGLVIETEVGRYRKLRETAFVVNRKKVLVGVPSELMRCDRCGWSFSQTPDTTCVTWNCSGTLAPVPDLSAYWGDPRNVNFEYNSKPPRMIVEEDSGNLTLTRRTVIERKFKNGKIDLIVCTPTLELGIDIGDLVSVGMARVPPSPASYAQRAGRAGRREKIALASTFLFHNPIDMYYFQHPKEIILGEISAPVINLENRTIIERHVNSMVVEDIFVKSPLSDRFSPRGSTITVRAFIDEELEELVEREVAARRETIVAAVARAFKDTAISRVEIEHWVDEFPRKLTESLRTYQQECDTLLKIHRDLSNRQRDIMFSTKKEDEQESRQISRILGNIRKRFQDFPNGLNRRDIFSHLSRTGVLPRYSFPGVAVETVSDELEDFGDRDARTAVTERVPGAPLYMNKFRYQVIGYDFITRPEDKDGTTFWVCQTCHIYASEFKKPLSCPECGGHKFKRYDNCIAPRIVVVKNKGRPSGTDPREYIDTETDYFILSPTGIEEERAEAVSTALGEIKSLGQKEILTLTTGTYSRGDEIEPFYLCPLCGRHLQSFTETDRHRTPLGSRQWCQGPKIQDTDNFNLYHRFRTNAISMQLDHGLLKAVGVQCTPVFLTTLKNALVSAAEIVLNADEGEIDGVIKPEIETIIFFDNVDGGVGYVEQFVKRFDLILDRAIDRVLSPRDTCEKGCVKCLHSFRRRRDIARPGIDKRTIIPLFSHLARRRLRRDIATYGPVKPYAGQVITIPSGPYDLRGGKELRDLLLTAQESIKIVTLYVTDDKIDWESNGSQERASWCDILCRCRANGVSVEVIIGREPSSEGHRIVLDQLEREGVDVRVFHYARPDDQPAIAHFKQIVVDGDSPSRMAAVETSANLSRETYTSANTFIFGMGPFNRDWIHGVMANIEAVEQQSLPWHEFKLRRGLV